MRRVLQTPPAEVNRPKKPGLLGAPGEHRGPRRGIPGPDAGYALTLAHRIVPECALTAHESRHDVEVGVALLAAKRAALAGRAPVRRDVEVALDLFGFRFRASDDVVRERRAAFAGVAHSYDRQRALVDSVPDERLAASTAR